ncbi:hypothetical protein Tco_1033647 [Tanacetum coccineum]
MNSSVFYVKNIILWDIRKIDGHGGIIRSTTTHAICARAKRSVLRQNATNEAKRSVLRQNAMAKRSVLRQNATNEAKRSVLRQNADDARDSSKPESTNL